MKKLVYLGVLFLSATLGMDSANADLSFTVNNYTTDEITFTISGTFANDTVGQSEGYLAIKNDWSNNVGFNTQWFYDSGLPVVTSNTILIGGLTPGTVIQNGTGTWQDNIFFRNPLGSETPILAGTTVTGSVTLSAPESFDPSDISTLELVSGFNRPDDADDWARLEARAIPEPSTLGFAAVAAMGLIVRRRKIKN